jgi:nucleotide-binding universal stress UspA family protein
MRVVAGVSTVDSRPVVRWAAEEAVGRQAELRLVTASAQPGAAMLHAQLATDVLADWPDLVVTTSVVAGAPAEVLRAEAAEADLLVVGADDASPFTEALRGSVPGDLLTSAPCPLAVIPRRGWTTPASAPVVVALDESTASQAALAYGYATTARTGQPLTVLRCGTNESLGSGDGAAEMRLLMAFEELYPDVVVSTEVVRHGAREALVPLSRQAALVVLGVGRRGRRASSVFGSLSRELVRRGGCPVVVAHPQPVRETVPLFVG